MELKVHLAPIQPLGLLSHGDLWTRQNIAQMWE